MIACLGGLQAILCLYAWDKQELVESEMVAISQHLGIVLWRVVYNRQHRSGRNAVVVVVVVVVEEEDTVCLLTSVGERISWGKAVWVQVYICHGFPTKAMRKDWVKLFSPTRVLIAWTSQKRWTKIKQIARGCSAAADPSDTYTSMENQL